MECTLTIEPRNLVKIVPSIPIGWFNSFISTIIRFSFSKSQTSWQRVGPLHFLTTVKNKKLEIYQNKWYKNISQGNIEIKNEIYTLMKTENKRKLIYDNQNKFIDTLPLKILEDKIVE